MSDQTDDLHGFAQKSGVLDEETLNQMKRAEKPTVVVPGGSVTISQSAEELYGHIAPHEKLFLRDGNVYQLLEKHGQKVLELLKPASACSKFEEFVNFGKWIKDDEGKPKLVPTVLNKEAAEKYLAAAAVDLLPEIRGMINCPILVERDGELHIVQNGYDPVTKLFVSSAVQLRPVTLENAIFYLKGVLQEFDFQTAADRSRAVASLITPAMKFGGFLKNPIPADVAEADQSQAGKTHRQIITAAIYNEKVNLVIKKEGGGVGSLDESFGTCLVEGRPFIQFDNVRGKMNSQLLESFLTATGPFPARPAYSKTVSIDPSKFAIFINSNGYEATKDLSNRSSIIRIKKRPGHPFKDMLGFVKQAQPVFLASVFAVIEEWHGRGKPKTTDTRHDFREWSQTLDWIVQNILGEAPLMDGHIEAQRRVSSTGSTFLRAVALAVEEKKQLKHKLRATEIVTLCQQATISVPGLSADKRNDQSAVAMAVGKVLGDLFAEMGDRIDIEDFVVTRFIEKASGDSEKEFESKTYLFARNARGNNRNAS